MPILMQIPLGIKRVLTPPLLLGALALSTLSPALSASAPELVGFAESGPVLVGFSPDGHAEDLVLNHIGRAQRSIRLAAYSLSSPKVVAALIAARGRGVDVQVVADFHNNVEEDRSGKQRRALSLLIDAGIPTRTIDVYTMHHDKYCIVDGRDVQTGSFNYSTAAARYNSENVIVLRGRPDLASLYMRHWQSRFDQGRTYPASH